jgi:hypothetical protein
MKVSIKTVPVSVTKLIILCSIALFLLEPFTLAIILLRTNAGCKIIVRLAFKILMMHLGFHFRFWKNNLKNLML